MLNTAKVLDKEPLNGQQLCSIEAVLAYLSHNWKQMQAELERALEEHFCVEHYSRITQADYPDAMTFLVDFHMEEIRSKK